ncbi:hypothetical protein [Endozoicomonas sp. YOMI1]|uniref:hypothetical protein n=1 Tax=Endozoicomonas sp. YOMI1 TaxID=2828739 RepID=UPI002148A154|nr:hypothetical protein [Endozoicomonas sp. YOMI1]
MFQSVQIITGKSEKDLYLFFVEGFGRLTQLVASFTIVDAALVILFFVAGNVIATVGYKAVVYARRLKQYH